MYYKSRGLHFEQHQLIFTIKNYCKQEKFIKFVEKMTKFMVSIDSGRSQVLTALTNCWKISRSMQCIAFFVMAIAMCTAMQARYGGPLNKYGTYPPEDYGPPPPEYNVGFILYPARGRHVYYHALPYPQRLYYTQVVEPLNRVYYPLYEPQSQRPIQTGTVLSTYEQGQRWPPKHHVALFLIRNQR